MKEPFSRWFGKEGKDEIDELREISVHEIIPSPYQPRTIFDEDRIEELCETIQKHGVIQPIVVRKNGAGYEVVAGERRLRAVQKLKMDHIPAVIRQFDDGQAAAIALIENLQREGLTVIEEAHAYQRLMKLQDLTQEGLAKQLGKGQSTIANKVRLLQLPEGVQHCLLKRMITERHARALLPLPSEEVQLQVLQEVLDKEWNVKQTEQRVEQMLSKETRKRKSRRKAVSKDVRIAINTILQSIDMVKQTGMQVDTVEEDHTDHYEVVIRIPKQGKRKNETKGGA
ncbi:nucleoid occlusion protein [Mechercharimyces sp. CAU 1602]|uniref:nucleoid occlusion protein n=1 Tax=Mechercharimyces sp. CAU 1602 TaxID=2973933 RepID=UPI0021632F74|nr:nucleoid occlusion protein [Mechercharimyces sp. CAU 1602]MCS1352689.1 nucleoid occlusion protein [Mechercharimyces sp. CAU 1602]